MKTKLKIKNAARNLFNDKGFKNVTLREVAKKLAISYGNVTYHYPTKSHLILALYEDMLQETAGIIQTFDATNLFKSILEAPKHSFTISLKYLFFYVDFIEIKRTYPTISSKLDNDNNSRKKGYLQILKNLQLEGILRTDLTETDLNYLMDLSGAMRTFFFIKMESNELHDSGLQNQYVDYVNRLIFPYLTTTGIKKYNSYLETNDGTKA